MLLVRLISEHSTLHATSTPATRPCYPRYRPVLSQVDSTEAEALRRRTAKQPNDLNAMPDCLPSTLQHNIHPRLLRGDGPVARAHGKSPSPRRAGRAEHLSVGHHCDPMISNPCRREALCFNEGIRWHAGPVESVDAW